MQAWARFIILFLIAGLAGCDGSNPQSPPVGPTPLPPPTPPTRPQPDPRAAAVRAFVRDTAERPLVDATVSVLDGPNAGMTATTDASGSVEFMGTFDDTVRFRASKAGHLDATRTSNQPLSCPTCQRHVTFTLELTAPPVDIAGNYTVAFIADPSCPSGLPEGLRTRSYAAVVSRDPNVSWRFNVSFPEATLLHDYEWEGMSISAAGDYLYMLAGNYHGAPGILEQVAPDTYLGFDGFAEATRGAPGQPTMSTRFDGAVHYCELEPGSPSPVAMRRYGCPASARGVQCWSPQHGFTLTRR